jgi:hypothetical protein
MNLDTSGRPRIVLDLHQSSDVDLEIALGLKPEVGMRAHRIVTRKLITVKADTPNLEAANLMLQRHIGGLQWSTIRLC